MSSRCWLAAAKFRRLIIKMWITVVYPLFLYDFFYFFKWKRGTNCAFRIRRQKNSFFFIYFATSILFFVKNWTHLFSLLYFCQVYGCFHIWQLTRECQFWSCKTRSRNHPLARLAFFGGVGVFFFFFFFLMLFSGQTHPCAKTHTLNFIINFIGALLPTIFF